MAEERVRPARPHQRLTDDGRRMREVLTYARRGSRFTPTQAAAWEAHHERWVIPEQALDDPGFAWSTWFGREAPLIVEVGSGIGESTAALAAARPSYDVLALEVWLPGVADGLGRVAEAGVSNVRFCSVDAVWSMEHLRRGGLAGRAVDASSPTRGPRSATTSGDWSTPGSRTSPQPGWRPVRPGGWPRTGPTTPSRCATCWTQSPC